MSWQRWPPQCTTPSQRRATGVRTTRCKSVSPPCSKISTDCRLGADVRGIDGCSVPNWAISLRGLAQAFARFASADPATTQHAQACSRIAEACWDNPDLVAGPGRLDTAVMAKLPGRVLMKSGAEGTYCGALPEHGLGFAVKIDDGAREQRRRWWCGSSRASTRRSRTWDLLRNSRTGAA